MSMTELSIVKRYIRMANDGWLQGWHERNGGNLTYRLTADEVAEMKPYFDETPRPWVNMGVTGANLAGEYFLSTGSGKYFRNVSIDPEDSICVVEINERGDSYRIVWGLVNGGRPTSEFPSHFMNHSVRVAGRGAVDGARRRGHRPGHLRKDEGIRRRRVGASWSVRLRPRLRHDLRPDAHHREVRADLDSAEVHGPEGIADHPG